MALRELVLMVEGDGDVEAIPGLVARLLPHVGGDDVLRVGSPMRVGDIHKLVNKASENEFLRFVKVAAKRNPGAVLLLLDGDTKAKHPIQTSEGPKTFCAAQLGKFLAQRAKDETTAGLQFSFAAVFARQEFETWLLAGCPELAAHCSHADLEEAPRDAKGKIEELAKRAYKETTHQHQYTKNLNITDLLGRTPKIRSFHRLENALRQLANAVRNGSHVCTP